MDPKFRSGVSAVVLAAGTSSRMGQAKQLLRVGETSVLEAVLRNLRATSVDEIVLVLGASADLIRDQVPLDSIRVAVNEAYQEGMATSLQAGITHVAPDARAAMVVLADQPFVRPETMERLISEYTNHAALITMPVHEGIRGNPVIIDRRLFPEVAQLSGDVGFRAIFAQHAADIHKVAVDDPGVLVDLDEPADVERALRQHAYSGRRPDK